MTGLSMEPLKRHQKDFLLLGNLVGADGAV